MKTLRAFLLSLLFVATVQSQERTMVPATQADANGGVNATKAITPATFARTAKPMIGLGVPNFQSNKVQYVAWQQTNGMFYSGSNWNAAPSGWQTNAEMVQTNGIYAHSGATFGMVLHSANVAANSNSRFRSTLQIGAEGIHPDGSGLFLGFSTNLLGALPADNSALFGLVAQGTSQSWIFTRAAGTIEGSFGNVKWSNGVYNVCVSTDPTNISMCVVWPGHTNELRAMIPWVNTGNAVAMSNYMACLWAGTNGTLLAAGGRTNSQTISPRTGVETSDFLIFTTDNHADTIRVVVPAQYDSGTNCGNLMVFCHGNTGDYRGPFDTIIGDEATTGDSVSGYFNALATNNFIIASYWGDTGAPGGRTDSWGTTNSLACVDSIIAWVRQRYAFSNIFLWGESAGGFTALNYAAARHEKIAGILMNHATYNLTNFWPGRSTDINAAYGGTTPAQFTGCDPSTFPATAWAGIPIRCTSSTGDTVVPKATQTDTLVTLLGGVVAGNATNTALCPEIDDNAVAGAAGLHGGACYTPAVAAGDIAFLQRCIGYASMDVSAIGGDQRIFGTSRAGSVTADNFVSQAMTNTTIPSLGTNAFYLWNSNGVSSTNAFYLTVSSNGVSKTYHLMFQP